MKGAGNMKKIIYIVFMAISFAAFGATVGLEAGDLFPEITLYNTKGKEVGTSADHRGKVTIYNFGASWCPPCKIEKPMLNTFYNNNLGEVNVVSIMVDQNGRDVDKFYKDNPMDFPHYFDKGQILSRQFLIRAVPTTYIVDEEGVNLIRIPGAIDWSKLTLEEIRKIGE